MNKKNKKEILENKFGKNIFNENNNINLSKDNYLYLSLPDNNIFYMKNGKGWIKIISLEEAINLIKFRNFQ